MPKHAQSGDDKINTQDAGGSEDKEQIPSVSLEEDVVTDAGSSADIEEITEKEEISGETPEGVSATVGAHGVDISDQKASMPLTPQQQKSRRMKRILIVVIILLFVFLVAIGYLAYLFIETSNNHMVQQVPETEAMQQEEPTDSKTAYKKTTVPDLTALIGKTKEEAVEQLSQYGAAITGTSELNEEGSILRSRITVALTEEPGDARSGTPTVYLGLDEAGIIRMAGYSAPTSTLGYGAISFTDAVADQFIVEHTLNEAGLSNVAEGTAVLPEDKTLYSTYASDGTTLVKENYTFEGSAEAEGKTYTWSSVLTYDYVLQNTSGNREDTIRQIYIYINEA